MRDERNERNEWNACDLDAARARSQARREWRLTHGEHPLPAVDSDGHVLLPATLVAQRAEEEEVERLAFLTPLNLDRIRERGWREWLERYELHKPAYLRLCIGARAEMVARATFQPWRFEDVDERHPDAPTLLISGERVPEAAEYRIRQYPRAFANERVLQAIHDQFLYGQWLPEESNKWTPTPLTIEERLQAMADEREARAAAKRQPGYNYRLILEGGRGW